MTKQEQIAEMANDIAKCCPDKVDDGCFDKKMNCVSCIAMELYNAGYRKVPENVILLDFNTDSGTASYTVMPRDEFVRDVSSRKAVEKNAVKEFAEKVKMAFYYEFDEIIPSVMSDKIDELLKEYEK